MPSEAARGGRLDAWLVWIGNWGLALAGLGCLPQPPLEAPSPRAEPAR
ncbi:hypothetical protein [Sinimarinibacterium thermocellulolyticum]|uniref:Uncharacterized protein n=1 Tax=Sinimarinibacterium thermocellulolyticum TaxID=3170016 RepID=A0ABV2ACE9_9GAMM